jgi:hypothetical protein
MTCQYTETLQLQSRITNESQIQFGDVCYTTPAPQLQSTINLLQKSSNEQPIFKDGVSRVDTIKSYQQVEAHQKLVY